MTEECNSYHSVTTWTNEKALGDLMVLLVRFTTQQVLGRKYLDRCIDHLDLLKNTNLVIIYMILNLY